MLALFRQPHHRTLVVLVLATLAAFWMRSDISAGLAIGLGTLAIAYLKGRQVILDFMELRHAPVLWRGLIEGWLLLVCGLIFAFYAAGQGAI